MSQSLLNRGMVKRDFAQAMEVTRQKSILGQIAHQTRSSEASSRYAWLEPAPKADLFEGKRRMSALSGKKIDITNRVWDATVLLDYDDMRRDQTGTIGMKTGELADSLVLKPWERIVELLKDGDQTTQGLAYDGQKFFDTDHAEGESGTQKNVVTASEVSVLNVGTATAPTPEEFVTAVTGVVGYMMSYKDSQGRSMNENARDFVIVIPATGGMLQAAMPAVASNNLASGETNPLIAGRSLGFNFQIAVAADLDWTAEFAVLRTDGRTKPFICQTETAPNLQYLDEDSDFFKLNRAYGLISEWVGDCAYGQWQYAAKATLS